MQFRDGGDQAEAKTQPWVATAFIGTIEASRDEIAFGRSDAGSVVADAHDALVAHASKAHFDGAAFGREFHGIVDEIGHGLEQKVTVARTTTSSCAPTVKITRLSSAMGSYSSPTSRTRSASATGLKAARRRLCAISVIRNSAVMMAKD
jgi:hypothetical protein